MKSHTFILNDNVKQILLGSLLGDGYLTKLKNDKNAFYRELHSKKQKEYLLWKYKYLKIFDVKLHEYSTYDKRTNKIYDSILLWSKVNPLLTSYHELLYINGKKTVTGKLLDEIGLLGLAIWYLDDGHYNYRDGRCGFATDIFSYEENLLLKNWLRNKFGISTYFFRRKKKDTISYTINLSSDETLKFLDMINMFVPKCMHYKLGPFKPENYSKLADAQKKAEEYKKLHYEKNKDKEKKRRATYYKNNKDRLTTQAHIRHSLNRDSILKNKKEYYKKNKRVVNAKQKSRRQNNIEKYKKREHEYYLNNRETILKRSKEYLIKNKSLINKRRRENYKKHKELVNNENFH